MTKRVISLVVAICIPAFVLADVPVYRDQSLSIKEALVVTASGTSYYKDIKLSANPEAASNSCRLSAWSSLMWMQ